MLIGILTWLAEPSREARERAFQQRVQDPGPASEESSAAYPRVEMAWQDTDMPKHVRLSRKGDMFTAEASSDGELYVMANTTATPFGDTGVVMKIRTKPGDVDADGVVDVLDLIEVLGAWGPCDGCPQDIDGNGVVDVLDLLLLLGNWG